MVIITCHQDRKASAWQISAPVHSGAVPADAAALHAPAGSAPALASSPALCAFFPSPTSPSPGALCQAAASGIPAAPAPSAAAASHPAHE